MSARRRGRPAAMAPARIELHIEELVLHGFAPGDRRPLGEAVERELTRLLGGGAPAPPPRAQGGAVDRTGLQVAQAVYAQIGGTTKGRER